MHTSACTPVVPIGNACRTGYPHDSRADNAAYRHDRRADNAAYRHDRRADSLSPFILPYALADILGRLAQRLLVADRKRWIIVQRFKRIKTDDR